MSDAAIGAVDGSHTGVLMQHHAFAAQAIEDDAGNSGSSFDSARSASTTVTAEPSRRKACAISIPIGPAPMTTRWAGKRGDRTAFRW